MNNNYSVSTSIAHSYEMDSKLHEIDRCLEILQELPWFKLPLSDSYRKYQDRYFKAVHIFNKYLSSSAFDSLNISETSLTDIEISMRSLYEYKLRSYNIGLDLDETEKTLKLDARLSGSMYSRNTNFDFFEEPDDSIYVNTAILCTNTFNQKKLPKIKINTLSNTSTISTATTSTLNSLPTSSDPSSTTNSPFPPQMVHRSFWIMMMKNQ